MSSPSIDSRPAKALAFVGVTLLLLCAFALVTFSGASGEHAGTIQQLRLTRYAAALIAGALLSVSGVAVQAMLRNPLASPSILGTTAGAALGQQMALYAVGGLGLGYAETFVTGGAFVGAAIGLAVLLLSVRARTDAVSLLLTGFVLSSVFLSLGGLVMSLSQGEWELGRSMVAVALGGVANASSATVGLSLIWGIAGMLALWLRRSQLDLLMTGDDEAHALGLNVAETRLSISLWVAVMVAASVSLGGNVAFVGLVVPHVLRSFVGAGHRLLLPTAAVGGGLFLVVCDTIVRSVHLASEIPLGVITGLIGGPLFFVLLRNETTRRLA